MGKALFILFKDYSTSHDGGGQANMRNLNLSKQILGEQNVDCYYIHDIHRRRSILSIVKAALLFPFGYFNGLTPSNIREIIRLSAEYDYIFITNSIFGLVAKRLKEAGYHGRIITFFHNVESIYYESRVSHYFPLRHIIIDCAARNDHYALDFSDSVVGLCERDHLTLLQLYGRGFDHLAPISFEDSLQDVHFNQITMTAPIPVCTFIGSNFPANSEGVLWFVNNVLPHVNIQFKIVGQNMNLLQQQHDCLRSIPVYSDIPDLMPFFMEADFMIFPIFDGSGMKVKTCEALMYGKNILGTNETFVGYDVDPNQCGRLCNTAEEYIASIHELCQNPIQRFNAYSRNLYLDKYSGAQALTTFQHIYK